MSEIPDLTEGRHLDGLLEVERDDHTEQVRIHILGWDGDRLAVSLAEDHPELGCAGDPAYMPRESVTVTETVEA